MVCCVCQAENDSGARFCLQCGTELIAPPPPDIDNSHLIHQLNNLFAIIFDLIVLSVIAASAFVAYDIWRTNNVQTTPFVQSTTKSSPSVPRTQPVSSATNTYQVHISLIPEDTSPQGIALRSAYEKDILAYLEPV